MFFCVSVPPSSPFLIRNHDKCITVESNHIVEVSACNEYAIDQVWRWTAFGQLQNLESLKCLSAPDNAVVGDLVNTMQCNQNDGNQIWIRQGKSIVLSGTSLRLNYPQTENSVQLNGTVSAWNQWELVTEEHSSKNKIGRVI